MKITLSPEEKQELEVRHNQEKNHRKADRIKSVLLRDEGWSLSKIAQALRLHNDTVSRYISDYQNNKSFDVTIQQILTAVHKFRQFSIKQHG